jgi:flagellar hook-associated protein 1 FlgK
VSVLSLFNIGLSGLETSDQLLQVTGNNVANAQTPNYTVEQAVVTTVPSGVTSSVGSSGNGVQVSDITRAYNSFVNAQVNAENSNVSYWNNYNTAITQVQDIFNEASSAGISPSITTYFDDWQNVAQSPQDDAQRTTLISDANDLSSSLNTAATSLNSVSDQLYTSSQTLVSQVNTFTAQIATLNGELAGNPGSLDLQDQRDSLLNQLNAIVKVSAYQDPVSGMYSVMLGGTPLVENSTSYNMSVATDSSNTMQFYVDIAPNAVTTPKDGSADDPEVTSYITGGQLASNIYLRNTDIPKYMNQLNAFAVDLADATNYYQKQGYGLDGSTGTNFFQPLSEIAKDTSVDSVAGVFTSPSDTFSTNGGTLTIKLGDNDTAPATITMAAGDGSGPGGAYTLSDVVNAINEQAGSKVTASVVDVGPAGSFTTTSPYSIVTDKGNITVPAGAYTGASLASTINTLGAAAVPPLGINVTYDSTANDFTITSTGGADGATEVTPASTIGDLLGFDFSDSLSIGTGITGSAPAPPDDRISIQSNPPGNLGNVSIGVTTNDAAGSGLNLLATSAAITSTSVTDVTSLDPKAQYRIDYNYTGGTGYQEEGDTGIYWRVMQSDDGGSTWTTINPNASYNPSDPSSLNETEVNLTPDSAGLSRTLEFEGIKVQIDGSGINSTTNPNGETFAVQLNPNAALDMATTITDPDQVAASSDTWNINSSNNSVVFNVNGGPNITAVIPSGTYTNDPGQSDDISSALTTAIQTAYENVNNGSALPDTLSAAFNPNTKQFNITMSSGSDSINFLWSNSASTANQIFGFSNDASLNSFTINGAGPNQNNTIVFNDGSGNQTATISTAGSPYTGAALAAAINAALTAAEPATTLSVTYNGAANNFTISNSGGAAATINWGTSTAQPQQFGFVPGVSLTIPAAVGAISGSVSSAVVGNSAVSDDPASVEANATQGLPGDNTNANTIANLANGTMFAGTTPTDMYMSMVSNIGVDASSANTNQQYHTTLMSELTQQQQQVSGVSMDEEASNLVIYQKSYEAAAELITTANQMLTTLMQMVNPNA